VHMEKLLKCSCSSRHHQIGIIIGLLVQR
jgi:hypothetical protein